MGPVFIIFVMGVSGSGKSTLGKALSSALHLPFLDADDLHPAANIAKMTRGQALTDADREPWLEIVRRAAEGACGLGDGGGRDEADVEMDAGRSATIETGKGERGVVIACSALKRSYRDILRGVTVPSHLNPPPRPSHSSTSPTQPQPRPLPSTSLKHTQAPAPATYFVYIEGKKELIADRMEKRAGHFMRAVLLNSQLETLESPVGEEGVIVVRGEEPTEEQVGVATRALAGILGKGEVDSSFKVGGRGINGGGDGDDDEVVNGEDAKAMTSGGCVKAVTNGKSATPAVVNGRGH